MHSRQPFPTALQRLVDQQAGVISTRQLRDGGLSPRAIERMARDWTPVAFGLHLLKPPSFHAATWAGLLRGGPDAVVGGAAAGHLHGAVRDAPSDITIWAPKQHTGFALETWRIRFRRAMRSGVFTLTRTPIDQTLMDIADESDENEAISAVVRALVRNLTTTPRVLAALESNAGVRHRAVLRELCAQANEGIESALEWRFQTEVLIPHGLPIPRRQVNLMAGRADGVYADHDLIVELDGIRDHTDGSRDMLRDNDNAIHHDARTVRFGWNATLFQGCRAARQVAAMLWKGRWREPMLKCRRCLQPTGSQTPRRR